MSAKTLERTIGTSYHVAWMMLQRFRVAMVNAERSKLSGTVEVDETLIGGEEHGGKRGRGTNKDIVVAVEIKEGKGFGRTRMRHIPDASGDSMITFIQDSISPGATLVTDGWSGYTKKPLNNTPKTAQKNAENYFRPYFDKIAYSLEKKCDFYGVFTWYFIFFL